MEWHEAGNPRNVVPSKKVIGRGGKDLTVGDDCDVQVQEGTKRALYPATLLGIGKCGSELSCNYYA